MPQLSFKLLQLGAFLPLHICPFTTCALGSLINSEIKSREINIFLALSKWMIFQVIASLNQIADLIPRP